MLTWSIMVVVVLKLLFLNFEVWFIWGNCIVYAVCRAIVYEYNGAAFFLSVILTVILFPSLILVDAVIPTVRLRYFSMEDR
eukprot:UN19798